MEYGERKKVEIVYFALELKMGKKQPVSGVKMVVLNYQLPQDLPKLVPLFRVSQKVTSTSGPLSHVPSTWMDSGVRIISR